MIITYNNQSIETITWEQVTEEERLSLQKEFFAKPDFKLVLQQFEKISKDGVMVDKISRYYFRDIMAKTKIKGAKWTVEDVFNSAALLGIFKAKTRTNATIFDRINLVDNIDTAIRLGGHNIASFPPNFPLKTARDILNKYNINNNWYDFSCGWGVRLLSAISRSINYFGTDPNYLLTERLIQLYTDYNNNIGTNSIVEIRTQGSEIFIPEWKQKMGIAFSSPPYFDLEDYKIGKQSYNSNTTYKDWQEKYLIPTFHNIYNYLINEGILAINIKNNKTYKLADDSKNIAVDCGFELIDIQLLSNNRRMTDSGLLNNAENIFIFKKKNNKAIFINNLNSNNNNNNNSNKIDKKDNIKQTLLKKIDIFLIGVKSKKQLKDINIYNSENEFLGERYFATFTNDIIKKVPFLNNYQFNQYLEMTKLNTIELLKYVAYHRDCNKSFKTVIKLCEIIDTWNKMEENNYHLFLQIEDN